MKRLACLLSNERYAPLHVYRPRPSCFWYFLQDLYNTRSTIVSDACYQPLNICFNWGIVAGIGSWMQLSFTKVHTKAPRWVRSRDRWGYGKSLYREMTTPVKRSLTPPYVIQIIMYLWPLMASVVRYNEQQTYNLDDVCIHIYKQRQHLACLWVIQDLLIYLGAVVKSILFKTTRNTKGKDTMPGYNSKFRIPILLKICIPCIWCYIYIV